MNRLTERTSDGIAYTKIPLNESHLNKRGVIEQCFTGFVADRLAAYEDSGLSPEDCTAYAKGEAEKRIVVFENYEHLREIRELMQAEAEGRLVVLPCKVGTRVWVIDQDCDLCHDMYTEEPCLFGDCEYRKVIESVFLPGMTDEFGKTVFLTKEAAEKAIAEVGE